MRGDDSSQDWFAGDGHNRVFLADIGGKNPTKENPMCYKKPGPRCSKCTGDKLEKAETALQADPTDIVLIARRQKAQEKYDGTPSGIRALRATGDPNDAMKADIAEQVRAAQLAAYNQTVKDADGRSVSDLAKSEDWADRYKAASDPKATPSVLTTLAGDANNGVRRAVASHPNAPLLALSRSARDSKMDIRSLAAKHPNAPTQALEELAEDDDPRVRAAVAENPNLPQYLGRLLAQDDDEDVQEAVAKHTTDPDVLNTVFNVGSLDAQITAAYNPHLSMTTAMSVIGDDWQNDDVREAVRDAINPAHLVEALKDAYPEANVNMPREWLLDLLETTRG